MGRFNVGIVIPAYNEEKSIAHVISDVAKFGDVIIVDDNSSDSTSSISENAGAKVVKHTSNMGYEAALSTGIKYAFESGYEYVITTDADGELLAESIPPLSMLLAGNADLVVGIRSKKNRVIESFFGFITSVFLKDKILDPLCGMKGYTSKIYKKYNVFDSRKMIGAELLAKAIRDKAIIKQVSVDVRKREDESRYGGSIISFLRICRTIFLFVMIVNQKSLSG